MTPADAAFSWLAFQNFPATPEAKLKEISNGRLASACG